MKRLKIGVFCYLTVLATYAAPPQAYLELSEKQGIAPCSKSLLGCTLNVAQPNCSTANPTITLTNNSAVEAKNIKVSSSDPNYSRVSISSNTCSTNLPAHSSCSISFYTPQASSFSVSQVTITSTNAPTTYFSMNTYSCFAYSADSTQGIYKCSVNASGVTTSSSGCTLTSTLAPSTSITIVTIGATQYAFFANVAMSRVTRCTIDQSTHALTNCSPISVSVPFDQPFGVASATIQGQHYLYIGDSHQGLYSCTIAANGATTCQAPVFGPNSPTNIAFTGSNDPTYIYFIGSDNSTSDTGIYRCDLNSNGSINVSSCSATPFTDPAFFNTTPPAYAPINIIFATLSSGVYAYINVAEDQQNVGLIAVCPLINNSFSSGTCFQTTSPVSPSWSPYQTGLQLVNGTLYAYVPNIFGQSIYQCPINQTNGSFGQCISMIGPQNGVWGQPVSFIFSN